MKLGALARGVVVALSIAAVVAGCATDGQPVAATLTDPKVDTAALDTGDFPTRASAPFGRATDHQLHEALRMGDYVVVPFEANPDLVTYEKPSGGFGTNQQDRSAFTDVTRISPTIAANDALLGGFVSSFGNLESTARTNNREILHNMVLRYRSPQDATAAQDSIYRIYQGVAAKKEPNMVVVPLESSPGTIVQYYQGVRPPQSSDRTYVTAYKDYVLIERYRAPIAQIPAMDATVRDLISRQKTLLDEFTPTPGEQAPLLDPQSLLIYALPAGNAPGAVWGPRGMAHRQDDPQDIFTVLDETTSQTAIQGSAVVRADNPQGARKVFDSFTNDMVNDGTYTPVDSPPAFPTATCLKDDTKSNQFVCMMTLGRYYAQVEGQTLKSAQQAVSAQYLILTTADQNAR
ncbi:hypothetical protein GKZ92_22805 (plasmid) [Gordonia sp. 135]|uniref:DUF7373 family lipoprotein n=1 Tax=Gordonia sp. 135 TaxID=2676309 RepID=UPI0012BB3304|nr:hypothetical protein [Gordonia sp. 135]QGP90555.1 hypothetical protein GKZ92_22805 [Gordonia sp. 135]